MQNPPVTRDAESKGFPSGNSDSSITFEPGGAEVSLERNKLSADKDYQKILEYPPGVFLYLPHYLTRDKNNKCTRLSQVVHRDSNSNDAIAPIAQGVFCYLEDNHTSVIGMREEASRSGATIVCATDTDIRSNPVYELSEPSGGRKEGHAGVVLHPSTQSDASKSALPPLTHASDSTSMATNIGPSPYHLFVYPAQSNFSGQKYPLSWVNDIPSGCLTLNGLSSVPGSWLVALDAAAFVSTSQLNLSSYPAHFVAISFYKMFGFPTGLGALLVRKDCSHLLQKAYYGGGTVSATVSREQFHLPRPQLHER